MKRTNQSGVKTSAQDQIIKRSRRKAIKTNWTTLTEQNSSSSYSRSWRMDQTQTVTDNKETKINGMKANTHTWRPVSNYYGNKMNKKIRLQPTKQKIETYLVGGKQFKHQKQQLQRKRNKHCFEMNVRCLAETLQRVTTPNHGADQSTGNCQRLPYPKRSKNNPIWNAYRVVESKSQKNRKHKQTSVYHKFAETLTTKTKSLL